MSSPSTDINKLIQRQHELQQELQKLEITQRELKEKEDTIIRKQQELKTGSELEKNKKEILAHKFYFPSVAETDGKLDFPFFIRPSSTWPGCYTLCCPYHQIDYSFNDATQSLDTKITLQHHRYLFKPTEAGFSTFCPNDDDDTKLDEVESYKNLEEVIEHNANALCEYVVNSDKDDSHCICVQNSTLLAFKLNINQYMLTDQYQAEIARNPHFFSYTPWLLASLKSPTQKVNSYINQPDAKLRDESKKSSLRS